MKMWLSNGYTCSKSSAGFGTCFRLVLADVASVHTLPRYYKMTSWISCAVAPWETVAVENADGHYITKVNSVPAHHPLTESNILLHTEMNSELLPLCGVTKATLYWITHQLNN